MVYNEELFKKRIYEAWSHEFSGWDFAYLTGRMIENSTSWDYRQILLEKIKTAGSLLDLDTGGGEFLSSLQPLPYITCATEGYPPNVQVARSRLEPLGVRVFDTYASGGLPFENNYFDLVINRHGDIYPAEIHRILKPGKRFITQQVGGRNNVRLNEMLQEQVAYQDSNWSLDLVVQWLDESGFKIIDQREEFPTVEFRDIGAVVYYLKAIPWQVSDFTIEKYYARLGIIHNIIRDQGKFDTVSHRFYIEAQKN